MIDVNKLPDNVESLKSLIVGLNQEIDSYKKEIDFYKDENSNLNDLVRLLRMQHFAPKSEVINSEQLRLFNEAEITIEEDIETDEKKSEVKGYRRGKPKRKPFPDFIPREEVVIELPEEERKCPHDGQIMEPIGEEVSEKLDIVPAQMKVIVTKRIKCRDGSRKK